MRIGSCLQSITATDVVCSCHNFWSTNHLLFNFVLSYQPPLLSPSSCLRMSSLSSRTCCSAACSLLGSMQSSSPSCHTQIWLQYSSHLFYFLSGSRCCTSELEPSCSDQYVQILRGSYCDYFGRYGECFQDVTFPLENIEEWWDFCWVCSLTVHLENMIYSLETSRYGGPQMKSNKRFL